jgi:Pyruvate/2-oxoacid:ferredoxin oxidoreductase gamma subunit
MEEEEELNEIVKRRGEGKVEESNKKTRRRGKGKKREEEVDDEME